MIFPRTLTESIVDKLKGHEIIFLLGTRQTGKTTLTRLVAEASPFDGSSIFFFDLEDKEKRTLFNQASIRTLRNVLRLEGVVSGRDNLLIFDEIQLLDDPANLLKLLHDHMPHLRIIATGSSSLQIKHKFSDSLAGRKRVFLVEPLSFDEFLLFRGEEKMLRVREMARTETDIAAVEPLARAYHAGLLQLFEEYLVYGGYPEVVLLAAKEDKVEKLDSIASSYIRKDIREIARIDNIEAYNGLLKYLAVNTGAQFNLSSAQGAIGISTPTIRKYLHLLQETFIVKELLPFFVNKNKEISKNKKIFFKDCGIRNLLLNNFNPPSLRPDIGALYENFAFAALERERDILTNIYFYRTQSKTEVDFISVRERLLHALEVKAGRHTRVPKAIREFGRKYSEDYASFAVTIINQSYLARMDNITFLPAYLF